MTNPSGPYPNAFSASQQSEVFTSDGPRRVFYNPDGSPITPGNLTSTGGAVRTKPDITAADGVTTTVPGFAPFFGTSAAAPHAAAIAALVLSGNPGISPADVRTALTSTAIDIEAAGADRDTGAGIVMATKALKYTGATPQPLAVAGQPVVTPKTGDGDAFLEPGESGDLNVPVTDTGDGIARNVSVQVLSATAGATVTPATRNYGSIGVDQTRTSTAPFKIRLAADYPIGQPVQLRIKVSFVGYLSPQSSTATLATGQPSTAVTTVSYTGPAVAIPDGSADGVSVPLTVAGVGRLSKVTFSIDGATCTADAGATTVGIDHTYVGDLVGTLTAPDGTTVTLFSRTGSGGNNFCQTVFSDDATTSIETVTSADAPFTGTYAPAEPLSGLVGTSGNGAWTFTVADLASVDSGNLRAVSLHVSGYVGGA